MEEIITTEIFRRLELLEKSNIDWVALYLGVVSIIVAIGFYIITAIQNSKNSKETNLNNIDVDIKTARTFYHSNAMQIATIVADTPETKLIIEKSDNAAIESILNAYENACDAFFKKKINQQDFSDKYHEDIGLFVKSYKEKFAPPFTAFGNMLKYYETYHKKVKIKK
ncbi:MAG: hypothetical protein FWD47_12325 [Treponema sp.]|nr:hypothetical protein [Treponema sp.]